MTGQGSTRADGRTAGNGAAAGTSAPAAPRLRQQRAPHEPDPTGVGALLGQWSAVLGVAAGVVYAIGLLMLSVRLGSKYGLAPSSILSGLPQALVVEDGVHVCVPALLVCFLLRDTVRRFASGVSIRRLGAVVVVGAGCVLWSPVFTAATHRQSVVANWQKIAIVAVPVAVGLAVGWYLLRWSTTSTALGSPAVHAVVQFLAGTMCFAVLATALVSVVPLPAAQTCLLDGSRYETQYLYETDASLYLVAQSYGPDGRALSDGAFIWLIPRDRVASTFVSSSHRRLTTCAPPRTQPRLSNVTR